jgi:hypothetical protein
VIEFKDYSVDILSRIYSDMELPQVGIKIDLENMPNIIQKCFSEKPRILKTLSESYFSSKKVGRKIFHEIERDFTNSKKGFDFQSHHN